MYFSIQEFEREYGDGSILLKELENDKEYRIAVKADGSEEWSTFVKTGWDPLACLNILYTQLSVLYEY